MDHVRLIETEYRGPTNTRGSVIIARIPSTWIRVPFDHSASDAHEVAARVLAERMGWEAPTSVGNLRNGNRVFVCPFGVQK